MRRAAALVALALTLTACGGMSESECDSLRDSVWEPGFGEPGPSDPFDSEGAREYNSNC